MLRWWSCDTRSKHETVKYDGGGPVCVIDSSLRRLVRLQNTAVYQTMRKRKRKANSGKTAYSQGKHVSGLWAWMLLIRIFCFSFKLIFKQAVCITCSSIWTALTYALSRRQPKTPSNSFCKCQESTIMPNSCRNWAGVRRCQRRQGFN